MSFLSKLFAKKPKASHQIDPIEYKGFTIIADPIAEGGQFRVAGIISLLDESGEPPKEHRFIRSDVMSNKQDAIELMQSKAKIFIDQMNDNIF